MSSVYDKKTYPSCRLTLSYNCYSWVNRDLSANPVRCFSYVSLAYVCRDKWYTHRSAHAYNYLCTHRCAPTLSTVIYRERVKRHTDDRLTQLTAACKGQGSCGLQGRAILRYECVPVIKTSSQYRSARINAE